MNHDKRGLNTNFAMASPATPPYTDQEDTRVTLAYRDVRHASTFRTLTSATKLRAIPERVAMKLGPTVTELDISNNMIEDLTPLRHFVVMTSLVVDNNLLKHHSKVSVLSGGVDGTEWVPDSSVESVGDTLCQ